MNHEETWSNRYRGAGDDYLFGTRPNRFLQAHAAHFGKGQSALLVADGEGRNSVWLAEQGLVVDAMDISAVALEKARRLAQARGVSVHYEQADLLEPEWAARAGRDRYDWVIGIFIQFASPAERTRQFAAMQQLTRPGGRILLQGYTPKQLEYRTGGPSAVENLYGADMMRAAFAGWDIEELVEYEEAVEEGCGHSGMSALLGLVARKPLS